MSQVTTNKAKSKIAKAYYEGGTIPKITHVGWGVGGVNSENQIITPSGSQTSVTGEFLKKLISDATHPVEGDNTRSMFTVTLMPSDAGALGKEVSACGLYDEAGDLVCLRHFTRKTIDVDTRIDIDWIIAW